MMDGMKTKYNTLKNEIAKGSGIINVSACGRRPSFFADDANEIEWEGKEADKNIRLIFAPVDFNFIETMEMEMIEGRSFSSDFATDSSGYILNQEAIKVMNLQDPIGKSFSIFGMPGKIVGIVKNFHHMTMHDKIEPLTIMKSPNFYWLSSLVVRIDSDNIENTISFIETKWKEIAPDMPFVYRFLDEDFERMYTLERRLAQMLNYFSIFAIVIACLGLLGLVAFAAEQRTKEIGIRKVLGANSKDVIKLLGKDFVKLIVVANIIAIPISYFVMDLWLEDFAYRVSIGIGVFFISSLIVFLIASVTVIIQSVKAAVSNPVDSLKYE